MTPREALERSIAAWNRGDLDGYLELYAEDAVLRGAEGTLDRAGARAVYGEMMERHPGVTIDPVEIWADGDRLGCRFVVESPGALRLEGVTIMVFREGRCSERITVSERR